MAGKTPDGTSIEQTGFSAVVLRKQADGRWLMVIDHPFADAILNKK
jgi:ketosteroid isomerase-like protein